jgi:uncharacterized phosphosugar-binding protein
MEQIQIFFAVESSLTVMIVFGDGHNHFFNPEIINNEGGDQA